MSASDLAKHAFLIAVIGVLAIIGLKIWNKNKAENQHIAELQTLTSNTSMFEQFTKQDATATLLKSVYSLHEAKQRFDLSPSQAIDQAFQVKKDGVLENTDSTHRRLSSRQILIKESLLRNHENATRLGLFEDSLATDMLSRGEAPQIAAGPAVGQLVEIGFLIDPAAFPGSEKILPNLILRPPTKKNTPLDDFQITQAKRLADQLQDAGIIEYKTRDRIIDHYDEITKAMHAPAIDPDEDGEADGATEEDGALSTPGL